MSKETTASGGRYKATDHHSSAVVQLGQEAWVNAEIVANPNQPEFIAPAAMIGILKAARTSQKQEQLADVAVRTTERERLECIP